MISQIGKVIKFVPPKLKQMPILWPPVLLILFAGGLLVVAIFTTLAYQIIYLNRGYPGVSVADIEIRGKTYPEIVYDVSTQAQSYLNQPITIQTADESWTFTGQQLGLQVDVNTTADLAYQIGRSGNFLSDMVTHLYLLFEPQTIDPIIHYHSTSTEQVLQQLTNVINYPPQNAQLDILSATDVQVIPAQRGRQLHIDATQPLIEAAIFSDTPHPTAQAFTQEVIPAITDEDIAPVYQQVQHLLSRPVTFNFSNPTDSVTWQLEPDKLAAMLSIIEEADAKGQPQLTVSLNKSQLTPYIEEFARVINQDAVDAQLAFDEENSKLIVLQPSQDSRILDSQATYTKIAETITGGSHQIELPITLTPPAVPSQDIEALGLKELVSESTSYFKGSSQGRMRNIALAASKFDGVVVPPGEIFSFNKYIGPITAEEGFDESLIIYGNRTTVGVGGGVCQVSTTAFRTAFFGGFELVERWAHGYRVGWYETNSVVGLDATIYTPNVDLKFRNDSEHHLLIHTETDLEAGTITFKFFGTDTGNEVLISDPVQDKLVKHDPPIYEETPDLPEGVMKQVDWAKDGMDVTVTRMVKNGDAIIHKDEIVSHYKPWRAVYQVGTGIGN